VRFSTASFGPPGSAEPGFCLCADRASNREYGGRPTQADKALLGLEKCRGVDRAGPKRAEANTPAHEQEPDRGLAWGSVRDDDQTHHRLLLVPC
jgi:hypothetical protein